LEKVMLRPQRNLATWIIQLALSILLASICLHIAVGLLAQVWPWLVGIGLAVGLLALLVRLLLWWRRQQYW